MHTSAPSSITATAQVAATWSSSGSSETATRRSAAVTEEPGSATPLIARARTRRTLVSMTACRWPKAKEATAAAVYSPTPGRASSAAWSVGTSPACRSRMATAAACNRSARRG